MLLNEKLTTELRPTLFLAQLSNLLAGNISIVHKVTGSSRTFMGEEGSGVSAVDTAAARIRSGQSTHALVGARHQRRASGHAAQLRARRLSAPRRVAAAVGARRLGGRRRHQRIGRGIPRAGIARACRKARRIGLCAARQGRVGQRPARRRLCRRHRRAVPSGDPDGEGRLAISGASGAHEATKAEPKRWKARGAALFARFSTLTGHLKEAQFPFAIALAALAIRQAVPILPSTRPVEKDFEGKPGSSAGDRGRLPPIRRRGAGHSRLAKERHMGWPRRPIISAGRSSPSPASASSLRSASANRTIGRH